MSTDDSQQPAIAPAVASTRVRLSLAFLTSAILLAELALVRVFDVILAPTTGYMVITSAMFALGLGGIYTYVFPVRRADIGPLLQVLMFGLALSACLVLPLLNILPFDLNLTEGSPTLQVLAWIGMYLTLIVPFFLGGLVLALIFSNYSSGIHQLYLYDLVGAAAGCLVFIPLLPYLGPGGLLLVAAALALSAVLILRPVSMPMRVALVALTVIAVGYPLSLDHYLEFRGHANKRNNDVLIAEGKRELVRWDPVSKLDVFNTSPRAKLFSLDGGQQGSWMQKFDGDFEGKIEQTERNIDSIYHGRSSLAHYLYHGSQPRVLVIGSAVGNETLAALIFGARHVDAVELVGAMVEAARVRYADFNGNLFNHPKVTPRVGEGRTFLRGTDRRYDIIQMFSNHTSSSIASGTSAAQIAYLQTVEAYLEYFSHLTDEGMLQINHHIYPRMLTTAAQAWHRFGRADFWRHALVIEPWFSDTLPTVLIKMTPWTRAEVDRALAYMNREPNRGVDMPAPVRPSPKIFRGQPYTADFTSQVDGLSGIDVLVGTYLQNGLSYPVKFDIEQVDGKVLRSVSVPGDRFFDNRVVQVRFEPLSDSRGVAYRLAVSTDNADHDKAFSVWTSHDQMSMLTVPRPARPSYFVTFDPLDTSTNLVPDSMLAAPFPYDAAAKLPYVIDPVTDDKPYFGMIRKSTSRIQPGADNHIDRNTAFILNEQLLPFLSSDWLHLFVVGAVSLVFSLLFVFGPLVASRYGRVRWRGMGADLVYFSCLGAGFIMIEIAMIQVFKKLIGFPTHTFTTVVFALLISAGLGSALSKRLGLHENGRWPWIFYGVLLLGMAFIASYPSLFEYGLSLPLTGRIVLAVAMIFPLGLFMGMPFPFGIFHLGRREAAGIPWAWGMNGFFTVFGGFAAILISIGYGFRVVMVIALALYSLALLSGWRALAANRDTPAASVRAVAAANQ